jgi:hypothetical protein
MKYRTRTYYTEGQKALMWERWKFSVRLVASVQRSGIGPKWR